MLIPIGKQLVQQYLDTRDAFAERMPEHAADFPGMGKSPGWVPAFLSQHLPGIDWASIPIHETPDLIRNYPKGE